MMDGVWPILLTHSLSRTFSCGYIGAGLHVVLEAQRVADFVRHDDTRAGGPSGRPAAAAFARADRADPPAGNTSRAARFITL